MDVIELLREMIRHDTTNHAPGRAEGERELAGWVAARLREVGWQPRLLWPETEPERVSVVLRVPGSQPELPGLLVHAHLDVVPAEPERWSAPPFEARLVAGSVVGRGAVDMKDMAAMTLAVLLEWGRTGRRPRRDVVVVFVADEETDGRHGAHFLVEQHPALLTGVAAAIGEGGGSVQLLPHADGRQVPVARVGAGERGTLHLRLRAHGRAGHGSRPHPENPVLVLSTALHRIGTHRWPIHLSPLVRAQLQATADAVGVEVDLGSDEGVERALAALGEAADVARFTVRASTTPTLVQGGYKVNVIPQSATAEVDVRCPPGYLAELEAALPELIGPGVEWEHTVHHPPVTAEPDSPWVAAMTEALRSEVPDVAVVPVCLGGGTDAKAFSPLGIDCYGFAPLTPDPDGAQPVGVHGIDEAVPVASVRGGLRVLTRFLESV